MDDRLCPVTSGLKHRAIIGTVLVAALIAASQSWSAVGQQTFRVMDLTVEQPSKGGIDGLLATLKIPILIPSHRPSPPPLPLQTRIQSISSVSRSSGRAVVELLVRNSGPGNFYLPISRNRETLFENVSDKENRREFNWRLQLRSLSSPEEASAGGLLTYRSSTDPGTAAVLRPQESVVVRFGVDLSDPWGRDSMKWKDGIDKGNIVAQVTVSETVLMDTSTAVRRQYDGNYSVRVLSENTVPLSLQP